MLAAGHEKQVSSMNDFSAFVDMRRCKNLGSYNMLKIPNCLKPSSVRFPQSTRVLFLISTLNSFHDVWNVTDDSD